MVGAKSPQLSPPSSAVPGIAVRKENLQSDLVSKKVNRTRVSEVSGIMTAKHLKTQH